MSDAPTTDEPTRFTFEQGEEHLWPDKEGEFVGYDDYELLQGRLQAYKDLVDDAKGFVIYHRDFVNTFQAAEWLQKLKDLP